MSKHIGNAIAWKILGRDEHKITPLSANERVGTITSGFALMGVLEIAERFASAGVGFPIIHDITDCLRVGDISFLTKDGTVFTIEVKTSLDEIDDVKGG